MKFFTEAHRRSYDLGEAKELMMILKRRGLAITEEQKRQIVMCTDLATLDRWLDHALSVTSVDELPA